MQENNKILNTLLRESGVTQAELARRANVRRQTVGQYLRRNGKQTTLSTSKLREYARLLGREIEVKVKII